MTPSRPYLLRAIYSWIIDNGMTPQIVVNARAQGVELPRARVENGKMILNIHPAAVQDLELGNDTVSFQARFTGRSMHVLVPVHAVLAIYARENGKGLVFGEEPDADLQPPTGKRGGRHLTVVK